MKLNIIIKMIAAFAVTASFLSVSVASEQIEFETARKASPLIVRIVKAEKDGYDTVRAYDAAGNVRLTIWSNWYSEGFPRPALEYGYYEYKTSLGYSQPSVRLGRDTKTLDMLRTVLRSSSAACPVDLVIDRNTFKVLKTRSTCDPLASAGDDVRRG